MIILKDLKTGKDVSNYVINVSWGGSLQEAGRKLEFSIAYTTLDKAFVNAQISLGDRVELSVVDEKTKKAVPVFNGVVFMQSRNSYTYTMDFVAYDNLIYLAKSKMTAKYTDCLISDVITNVCDTLGVTVGELCQDASTYKIDMVADSMTGTEIIKKCMEQMKAWTGWNYNAFMLYKDGAQKLNVVRADTVIENFKVTAETNLTSAKHSASIEDMINQVAILDANGNITGYVKNEDDIKAYGLLQEVYKADPKQDTETAAKSMLKKITENSSISALGNIQCISGYAVEIQEEQLKGKFLIISDSHKFESNQHTMDLSLSYIVDKDNKAGATNEGNVNPSTEKEKKNKKKKKQE